MQPGLTWLPGPVERGLAALFFMHWGESHMVMQWIGALSLPGAIVAGSVALVVLALSANTAVKKMVDLAEYFKLSATFMGMTVISLATSIPEITAHLTASGGILAGTLDYEIGS